MKREDVTNEMEMEKALTFNGGSLTFSFQNYYFKFKVFVVQLLRWVVLTGKERAISRQDRKLKRYPV